jgi:hypothetical protein
MSAAAMSLALGGAAHATTYSSDPVLADFTAGQTYAHFTNYFAGDVPLGGYTPTNATLNDRVYDGGAVAGLDPNNNWILADFTGATSSIRVFENEDHFGAAYDGYQYQIWGFNLRTGGWDFLYDPTAVSNAGEPFTLVSSNGTAPTNVNNVLSDGGPVAYIADFNFGNAYARYAFGASTVAFDQGNPDQELSAVGTATVPEPATWTMLLLGFGGMGAMLRRRRRSAAT